MKPKICVPTLGKNIDEITGEAALIAAAAPDLIEFRADFLENAEPENIFSCLRAIKRICPGIPVIFTLRSKKEGGGAKGPKKTRAAVIKAVINGRLCEICDVELSLGGAAVSGLTARAARNGVLTIVSYHNFKRTPPSGKISALWRSAARRGPDYIKIAALARTYADAAALSHAVHAQSRKSRVKPIVVAMGGAGVATRVAGTSVTFAPLGEKTAPGQLSFEKIKSVTDILYGIRP